METSNENVETETTKVEPETAQEETVDTSLGKAIGSMILGFFSILLGWVSGLYIGMYISYIIVLSGSSCMAHPSIKTAILATVIELALLTPGFILGIIARKTYKTGASKAAIIMNASGLGIFILFIVLGLTVFGYSKPTHQYGGEYKPVIYLYPEETTDVDVNITAKNGEFTCVYPDFSHDTTWTVTAEPDGTLSSDGMEYNYLYWEAAGDVAAITTGDCIAGEDTAAYLEDKLAELGLTRKEANEFIVYWLPQMEDNEYNVISFDTTDYVTNYTLDIDPLPDTVIRVNMRWYPSDTYVDITPDETITTPERVGFTVVEWGGSKIVKTLTTAQDIN